MQTIIRYLDVASLVLNVGDIFNSSQSNLIPSQYVYNISANDIINN